MVQRNPSQPSREPHHGISGTIFGDALYRADEFKARMGWRDAAFRAACRKGLRTYRVGKRVFVTGADVLAFIQREGGAE
jgi:hypothetical protein